MPRGNSSLKLAITVDSEIHAKLLDAARAECTNVSGWLTEAARRALLLRDGIADAREWEAEHGALGQAELEQARTRLARPLTARRRRAR